MKDVALGKYFIFQSFRKGCRLLVPIFYRFKFNKLTQTGESTSSAVAGSLTPQFLKSTANLVFVAFASGARMN